MTPSQEPAGRSDLDGLTAEQRAIARGESDVILVDAYGRRVKRYPESSSAKIRAQQGDPHTKPVSGDHGIQFEPVTAQS